ncbi:hypothetical protein GCM10027271_44160 [Saccharopolyspora gloriosae]|uniref:Uncharacterized protein n=1 Tax=Saccharopolyspora gloriosae TaxID=455344 RepID=A0A840NFA9_9PSEU|nr:hypothetical protein [Saccharopolyspora gloriosae]MBB5070284.1 hypothetical protein [Saccharopolyspora gloriosae]
MTASTTMRDLRRWRTALLVLIGLTAVFSAWSFHRVHTALPAAGEVLAAREALVDAHRGAVEGIRSGEVLLSGPGEEYRTQLAIAQRHLTEVAQTGLPDVDPSRLEVAQGLLASYGAEMDLAATGFREDQASPLGTTYLWNATLLLDRPGEGVLFQLDVLRAEYLRAAEARVVTIVLWLVPAVLLLVLLVVVQVQLARRFRRVLNPPLVLATACAAGLAELASRILVTRARLEPLAEQWTNRTWYDDLGYRDAVLGVLTEQCPHDLAACGVTVQRWAARFPGPVDAGAGAVEVGADAALLWAIPVLAVAAALLVQLGLAARIDEYGYRSR